MCDKRKEKRPKSSMLRIATNTGQCNLACETETETDRQDMWSEKIRDSGVEFVTFLYKYSSKAQLTIYLSIQPSRHWPGRSWVFQILLRMAAASESLL